MPSIGKGPVMILKRTFHATRAFKGSHEALTELLLSRIIIVQLTSDTFNMVPCATWFTDFPVHLFCSACSWEIPLVADPTHVLCIITIWLSCCSEASFMLFWSGFPALFSCLMLMACWGLQAQRPLLLGSLIPSSFLFQTSIGPIKVIWGKIIVTPPI